MGSRFLYGFWGSGQAHPEVQGHFLQHGVSVAPSAEHGRKGAMYVGLPMGTGRVRMIFWTLLLQNSSCCFTPNLCFNVVKTCFVARAVLVLVLKHGNYVPFVVKSTSPRWTRGRVVELKGILLRLSTSRWPGSIAHSGRRTPSRRWAPNGSPRRMWRFGSEVSWYFMGYTAPLAARFHAVFFHERWGWGVCSRGLRLGCFNLRFLLPQAQVGSLSWVF